MRTYGKWALVVVIPALWAAPALPADPPERITPEGTAVPLVLLRQKSVQTELGLKPPVVKKIMDFTSKQYDAASAAAKLGGAEMEKKFNELEEQNKKFMADTLSEKQRKRLDQVTLQVTGLMQLSRPDVIATLKLTEEQQMKVKDMQEEARKGLKEMMGEAGKPDVTQKLTKLREETRTKILEMLTDEQKAKVTEMVGPSFKGEIVFEAVEKIKRKKGGK